MQITCSSQAAGAASQLLYVRASVTRFSKIYSSKGRWSLLDGALLVPQTYEEGICAQNVSHAAGLHKITELPDLANKRCVTRHSLHEVEQEVNAALASVLGVSVEGKSLA
jgi:hypothetical protein